MKKFIKQSVEGIFTNKFYMGICQSRKYGESQGKHKPMITSALFYEVQKILNFRTEAKQARSRLREDFALRGILRCPTCGNRLTSGNSRNKIGKLYGYYICHGENHRFNINRDLVEDKFLELLQIINYKDKFLVYFSTLLKEKYEEKYKDLHLARYKVKKDIEQLEETVKVLRRKHLKGLYTDEEYLEMKKELELEIYTKQTLLPEKKMDIRDINTTLNFMRFYLTHLDKIFLRASSEGRLAIGCSLFPKGVVFDGESYRTPELGRSYEEIRRYSCLKPTYVPLG